MCIGIISKVLQSATSKKKKKKTGLKGSVIVFAVDYNTFNTSDVLDIHRFLMKET